MFEEVLGKKSFGEMFKGQFICDLEGLFKYFRIIRSVVIAKLTRFDIAMKESQSNINLEYIFLIIKNRFSLTDQFFLGNFDQAIVVYISEFILSAKFSADSVPMFLIQPQNIFR